MLNITERNKILAEKILALKEEKDALILAHNYQAEEVQLIADYVGDSFGLSQQAAKATEQVIVFCGVHFMAESACILAPDKTVLLPDKSAGCPLADTINEHSLQEAKEKYPGAAVVCYVNSSASVKAISDVCCTSSNAIQVINGIDAQQILFVPDKNLAHWVQQHTTKKIIPWEGACVTHQRVYPEQVKKVRELYPAAPIAVHPECEPEIVAMADFVGSTTAIINFAKACPEKEVIIGTEMGVITKLQHEVSHKNFYLLSQGLICPNMKKTNLQNICAALESLEPKITVAEPIRAKAYLALEKMLSFK
jgi:quinolinate synthase